MLFKKESLKTFVASAPFTRTASIYFDNKEIPDTPLSLASFCYKPGQVGPKHMHEKNVEVYYCLNGKGLVIIEDKEFILEKNSALYIPPGSYHETKNIGEEDFEFIGIFAPCENFDGIREW